MPITVIVWTKGERSASVCERFSYAAESTVDSWEIGTWAQGHFMCGVCMCTSHAFIALEIACGLWIVVLSFHVWPCNAPACVTLPSQQLGLAECRLDGWTDGSYRTVNLFVPSKLRASSLGRTARQRKEEIFNTKPGYFPWQEYLFFSYAHRAVEKRRQKKHRSLVKTPSSPSISSRTHQTAISCQSPQMCSWISGRWKWSDALIENFAVSE